MPGVEVMPDDWVYPPHAGLILRAVVGWKTQRDRCSLFFVRFLGPRPSNLPQLDPQLWRSQLGFQSSDYNLDSNRSGQREGQLDFFVQGKRSQLPLPRKKEQLELIGTLVWEIAQPPTGLINQMVRRCHQDVSDTESQLNCQLRMSVGLSHEWY
jgi:hypothetical protein